MFNNANIFENGWSRSHPGINYNNWPLRHGSVVAFDDSLTDSDSFNAIVRKVGVSEVRTENAHEICGILQARNRDRVGKEQAGVVAYLGIAEALVYVPASLALPVGTPLCLYTTWDATNNNVEFRNTAGTSGDGVTIASDTTTMRYNVLGIIESTAVAPVFNPGIGTPATLANSTIPANPIAYLLEAIASQSSAGLKLVKVRMAGAHAPLPFGLQKTFTDPASGTGIVAQTGGLLGVLKGPGIVTSVNIQALVQGANAVTVDVNMNPLGGTADARSVLGTKVTIGASNDEHVVGGGGTSDATGDNDVTSTGSAEGVFTAFDARQFPSMAHLTADIDASGVTVDELVIAVDGFYF